MSDDYDSEDIERDETIWGVVCFLLVLLAIGLMIGLGN